MSAADDIGSRGESLCNLPLTPQCGRGRAYFEPRYLGGKTPTFDFLVELVGAPGGTPFFFVQVKAARRGYVTDRKGRRKLRISESAEELVRMQNYPAPAYVIGIDEPAGVGYIASVNGDCPATMNALPALHELNCANLGLLWQEVEDYWSSRDTLLIASRFGVQNG